MIGQLVADKYEVIDKLGEGGMGTVYRARQRPIDRLVAVKVLLGKLAEDEVAVKRFEQEARAVSKMQHPNTVTIFDYGQTIDGRLYLVMEFLKGQTLTDLLRRDGPLAAAVTIHIIRQVCASLGDAHAAGIIHRDLKPDNIFLTDVGADPNFVKVLDFGVAKLADNEAAATLTQTGMIFGTPKYMSPEQAEGKPIDFRADIYAIGVVMYELLTARPPFLADTAVALLLKHISQPPPAFTKIRPDLNVPPRLEAITMKALAKDPDQRYLTVEDLAHDLGDCLKEMTTGVVQIPGVATQPFRPEGQLPTEVVPGQAGRPDISPGDLRPPQAVPSGISLGVGPQTRGTEAMPSPQDGATLPAGAAHMAATAPAQAMPATLPDGSLLQHRGVTEPIPGAGPQIETLGGVIGLDASGPLRPPKKKANVVPMVLGGVGLLAAGFFAFLSFGPASAPPVSTTPLPAETAPAPADTALAPAPEPEEPTPTAREPTRAIPARKPRPTRRPAAEPAPAEVVKAPASKTVNFKFESRPPGAVVLLDGEQIGVTPFARPFPKGIDSLKFDFTKDGYSSRPVTAFLSSDKVVSARLEKVAVATSEPEPKKPKAKKPKPKPKKPKKPVKDDADLLNERVGDLKDF